MDNNKKLAIFTGSALVSAACKYITGGYIIYKLISQGFSEPHSGYYVLLVFLLFAWYKLQKSCEDLAFSCINIDTPNEEEQ